MAYVLVNDSVITWILVLVVLAIGILLGGMKLETCRRVKNNVVQSIRETPWLYVCYLQSIVSIFLFVALLFVMPLAVVGAETASETYPEGTALFHVVIDVVVTILPLFIMLIGGIFLLVVIARLIEAYDNDGKRGKEL
jgi:heme/copper-type cytochrome/quinol oxidase subunit 2